MRKKANLIFRGEDRDKVQVGYGNNSAFNAPMPEAVEGDTSHLHLWEFNSTDANGKPVDVSKRHPASKQLSMPADAKTIAEYSDPSFVLGGWKSHVQ